MKKTTSIIFVALLTVQAGVTSAQTMSKDAMDKMTPGTEMSKGAPSSSMTEGEVRKVDKEQGKITLKHGEIKNLGMPAMTMVFKAKDAAMLDKVAAGDKVQFAADQVNGSLTVTSIEKK